MYFILHTVSYEVLSFALFSFWHVLCLYFGWEIKTAHKRLVQVLHTCYYHALGGSAQLALPSKHNIWSLNLRLKFCIDLLSQFR